jgi:hypothetical protein
MSCHLKLVFEEVIFSSNIIKTPQVLKRGSMQKKEEKGKRKKIQQSSQIKGEVNILRGEKYFNFKDPF